MFNVPHFSDFWTCLLCLISVGPGYGNIRVVLGAGAILKQILIGNEFTRLNINDLPNMPVAQLETLLADKAKQYGKVIRISVNSESNVSRACTLVA